MTVFSLASGLLGRTKTLGLVGARADVEGENYMLGIRSTRRIRALVGHSVLLAVPAISFAGAGFTSGSATWSWDADSASALGGKTTFAIAPPSSSLIPASPTFQLSKSGSSGGSSATGRGSLGYVANPTTASWTFGGGSGASQNDPGNVLTGDTITKVRFGGLFDVTSPGFGPTALGYFSLTVAGTAGVSGSTQIAFDMQWRKDGPNGPLLRSSISNGTTFFGGVAPTPFSATYTYASPFSPTSLPATDNIWVGGSLTFIADNMGSPSDVAPVQFEASAAPPTATTFVPGGTSAWFAPATWQAPNNPAAGIFSFTELNATVPSIPNAIGDRARFVDVGDGARTLNISNPVTLGSLLIDDNDAITIQPTPSLGAVNLTFDTQSGGSSIHVGANAGNGQHVVNVPVTLNQNLDIRVEAVDPVTFVGSGITFNQPISNAGGAGALPRDINISGGGTVTYNATNSYGGRTSVRDGGQLKVNASGGLGSGLAFVENGRITLGTDTPFATSTGTISVGQNGVVRVDTLPASIDTKIVCVNQFAGVSGSPAALGSLTIAAGLPGNIIAEDGAFIGHTVFDLSAAGNPQGLGSEAKHTFGVSANMGGVAGPVLTIGTGLVNNPWLGIAGDRGRFAFGDPGQDGGVIARGEAEISSLAGEFIINTRFNSDEGGGGLVRIKGNGRVIIAAENNGYSGDIIVHPGASLSIDGDIAEVQNITVQAGATFGGGGSITDPTNLAPDGDDPTPSLLVIQDGGILDPGLSVYNNALGTFEADNVQLSQNSILDFEFGSSDLDGAPNDVLEVRGSLTLDGKLIINQLQDFDNQTQYTLIEFFGPLVNNGLEISPLSQEIFGLPAEQVASLVILPRASGATGGSVVLIVPEPSAALLLTGLPLLRARRRR